MEENIAKVEVFGQSFDILRSIIGAEQILEVDKEEKDQINEEVDL